MTNDEKIKVAGQDVDVVTITDFETFVRELDKLSKTDTYLFRGQRAFTDNNQSIQIKPSIFRSNYRENKLIDAVISRYPTNFSNVKNNMEVLLTMQHYEIPTRLIDVTRNPYIALYFALEKQSDFGEYYVFVISKNKIKSENERKNIHKKDEYNGASEVERSAFDPTVGIVAAMARLSMSEQKELRNIGDFYLKMEKALIRIAESDLNNYQLPSSGEDSIDDKIMGIVCNFGQNKELKEKFLNFTVMKEVYFQLKKEKNLTEKNVKSSTPCSIENNVFKEAVLDKLWDVAEKDAVVTRLLSEIKYYNPGFNGKIDFNLLGNSYLVEPYYSNQRIINQQGGFLVLDAFSEDHCVPGTYIEKVFRITGDYSYGMSDTEKHTAYERLLSKFQPQMRNMNIDKNFIYPEMQHFVHTNYVNDAKNYIAIYDISGIQSFIFATNKLREMAGGSEIVHRALFQLIPEKLGYAKNTKWEDEAFSIEIPDSRFGNVIYIGGGNALVLYKDKKTYENVTIALQKEIFEMSGGGIRLCHAGIEAPNLNDTGKFVDDIQKPLMKALSYYKQTACPIQTVRGFAFGAQDNETQEPLIIVAEKNDKIWRSENQREANNRLFASHSRFKKDQIFYESKNSKKEDDISKRYADNFEQFRSLDEKSFVAVIHIDGNTMGKQIIDFANKLKETTLSSQLAEMRKLSIAISSIYKESLRNTLRVIFGNSDNLIPYREIISDGDDITIIIKATKALRFCRTFVEELEKIKKIKKDCSSKKYKKLEDFQLSVGIGVTFVHDKFPFSTAYHLAEQLCKEAKKRGLENKKNNGTPSSIDFHIVKSGMTTDIESFRKIHCKNSRNLLRRPYIYLDKDVYYSDVYYSDAYYSYNSFVESCKQLKEFGIARNKLKELQEAYVDTEEQLRYVQSMIQRRCGMLKYEDLWIKDGENAIAKYFDALDILDYNDGGDSDGKQDETLETDN